MAIAIDQSTIGQAAANTSAATIPFTTSATVASGGFIVVWVSWFHSTTTLSNVAGGGLTWSSVVQFKGGASNNIGYSYAQAPAGLASGATITATFSTGANGREICGLSFTGVATSSPVDGTPPAGTTTTGTTAWATGSYTIAAGSVMTGAAYESDSNYTSTPTSPSIETHDFDAGAGTCALVAEYRIEAAGGSYTTAGTVNGTQLHPACACGCLPSSRRSSGIHLSVRDIQCNPSNTASAIPPMKEV